jgi:cysteine desulfurase
LIYFDNAATTKPSREAIEASSAANESVYGNPSSAHVLGAEAEALLKKSLAALGGFLDVSPDEIILTSGGTESNNMAFFGRNAKQTTFVTNYAEHASVVAPAERLRNDGYAVIFSSLLRNGALDMDALEKILRESRGAFLSVMHVNNETGVIQDMDEIGRLAKRYDAVFHVDGTQGFGKHRLSLRHVDLYTFSAHKIHGLKGMGALFIKKGEHSRPMFYGGHQQGGVRPGTENVAGAAAFAAAAAKAFANMRENALRVTSVKDALLQRIGDAVVNGENVSPYIANVSFVGAKAETIVNALKDKGICVSAGAACNAKKAKAGILSHYGAPDNIAESAVRISFSPQNTTDEAERCAEVILETMGLLRKFQRN